MAGAYNHRAAVTSIGRSTTPAAHHNGTELTAGVKQPLVVGDRIAIGAFTVIRVTAIRS